MTVLARRMVDLSQDATAEEIRSHVRARLERLVAALRNGGAIVRPGAE
ncbi:hypothetical protein [Methylobacterium terrae]|nr:hypothetical protein [Methylobacterium terrae]